MLCYKFVCTESEKCLLDLFATGVCFFKLLLFCAGGVSDANIQPAVEDE